MSGVFVRRNDASTQKAALFSRKVFCICKYDIITIVGLVTFCVVLISWANNSVDCLTTLVNNYNFD